MFTLESPASVRMVRHHHIYTQDFDFIVESQTVGQFTGLYDKNCRKIFEGDVVNFNKQIGHIVFEYGSYGVGFKGDINYKRLRKFVNDCLDNTYDGCFNDNFISLFEIYYNLNDIDDRIDEIEVIGNIYDNPELLEKGAE